MDKKDSSEKRYKVKEDNVQVSRIKSTKGDKFQLKVNDYYYYYY